MSICSVFGSFGMQRVKQIIHARISVFERYKFQMSKGTTLTMLTSECSKIEQYYKLSIILSQNVELLFEKPYSGSQFIFHDFM